MRTSAGQVEPTAQGISPTEGAPPVPETAAFQAEEGGQPTLPTALALEHAATGGPAPGLASGDATRIRSVLGEGGMGKVFLAHDEILGADVALKLCAYDVACQREIHKRLREEVLLAQKITHNNVCRTHDLEELEGSLLVKMEYIAGETLAARHRRLAQMPIDDILRIARAIAAGLEAAHAQQVVHCDLKPENVFIEHGTERVVLMDFGLARVEVRGMMGIHREISGTPAYMAPSRSRAPSSMPARICMPSAACSTNW